MSELHPARIPMVEPSGIALRDAEPRSGEGNRQPVRIYGSLAFVKVRGGSVPIGNKKTCAFLKFVAVRGRSQRFTREASPGSPLVPRI